MELLPVVCLCLLTRCGITSADANEPVVVTVKQDEDALLPCSLSTKENIEQGYFTWDKVAQNNEKEKEVFLYEEGKHSNNGFGSQDDGFKGRVSHFQEELKHGNASIIIRNTKMADSGDYTCTFLQPRKTCHFKLVVDGVLKNRLYENIPGVAPKPNTGIPDYKDNWALLQCEANGNPQPEVEWRDSAGKKLPAEEPQVSERHGRFYVILNTTVTKTDRYYCVVTQKTINHQIYADIPVRLNVTGNSGSGAHSSVERGNPGSGANSSESTGWTVSGVLGGLLFFVIVGGVVLAVLIYMGCIPLNCKKGSPADHKEGSVVPLKSQPSRSQEAPDPET